MVKKAFAAAVAAACLSTCFAGTAPAAVFNLRAAASTKTMPDGRVVPVWGFAQDSAPGAGDGAVSVPGPALVVPPGDASLTINLQNSLPEPVSIVIPGQVAAMTPVRNPDGRVRSFTHETAPGGSGAYTWSSFRPGTYLYQSGSHVAVQVQMGLYGAVEKDSAAQTAYPGVPYARDVVLLFSEIDPELHDAVATPGGFGPGAAVSSTVDYEPRYFLVNGEPFSNQPASYLFAGRPGERILLRLLNAGLETHTPVLQGLNASLLAEDGNPYPYPRSQYSLDLPALKTLDAVITPTEKATVPVYDRRLCLTNDMQAPGGMLAFLKILPPLVIEAEPEVVAGGSPFAMDVELNEPVTRPFDFYLLADTPYGIFTVSLDGRITPGIRPLFRNIPGIPSPIFETVWSQVVVPPGLRTGIYTFYAGAIEAGTVPPVAGLAELLPTTPNVILLDKEPVEMQ